MKKIVFVCLGNICRSPMAEFVMKSLTNDYHRNKSLRMILNILIISLEWMSLIFSI